MGNSLSLNESILYNLSCLESGIDSRSAVCENILKEFASNLVDVIKELDPEKIPAALLQILYERYGITVILHNGTISDVFFESCTDMKKGA